MAFPIEIITTDKNLLADLAAAFQPLNTVQNEFRFDFTSNRLMEEAFNFQQQAYTNVDILNWLEQFKGRAGGNHPFIILVISKPLSGEKQNLYGSHRANLGFAWFTTETLDRQSNQFLFDKIRFCRYYLVRYILSFVAPTIKSHDSITCMFDNKNRKRDIRLSYDSGIICDSCLQQLRQSPQFNVEVNKSINKFLAIVSNQHPRALVMKGGGAKGLALIGALKELEKHFTFDTFAGTSAGAIAAILLAAGYTPSELEKILSEKDFSDFKSNIFVRGWNLIRHFALHSGRHFFDWLDLLLKQKLNSQVSDIQMKNLPRRAIVYASWVSGGLLRFDSKGERAETGAAFATRCSMSIPFFFVPERVENTKVYDGGLGNNFPLRAFLSDNGNAIFLGLYLISEVKKNGTLYSDLRDIVTDSDERQIVDQNLDKIIVIDPRPIKTKQFSLSPIEKSFLLQAGKVGALKYLNKYHGDLRITNSMVETEEQYLAILKKKVENRIMDESNNENDLAKSS